MYTKCFVVTIARYVYKMFCCHNRKICIQNVLLSQSQDMYTKCFAVTLARYVYKLFCCHNRKICIQNIFAGTRSRIFCFTHSVTHTRTIKKIEQPHVQIQNNGIEILLSPSRSVLYIRVMLK